MQAQGEIETCSLLRSDVPRLACLYHPKPFSGPQTQHTHACMQAQGEIDERGLLRTDVSRLASPRFSPTWMASSATAHHGAGGRGAAQQPGQAGPGQGGPKRRAGCEGSEGSEGSVGGTGPPAKLPAGGLSLVLCGGAGGAGAQPQAGPRPLGAFASPPAPLPSSQPRPATGGSALAPGPGTAAALLALQSPLPLMCLGPSGFGPAATPVSEALGAAAWLRGMTASVPPDPSPALLR
jgi:hypothetical protein